MKTLIVVVGPTAVGKTAAAIRIAQHFGTEILSCDSRQFYRELNIGVARPSEEELAAVPHHFIANASIYDSYNVFTYEQQAMECLENLFRKHDKVVAVGGSGLYVDALCRGIAEMPDPDPEIRRLLKRQLEAEGVASLRAQLKLLDPDYYNIVDLANPARLIRALEMCLTTGRPFSEIRNQPDKVRTFGIFKVGLSCDRGELYDRINRRVDVMLEAGLENEVRGLCNCKDLNTLNTVGYKEFFEYFDGEKSLDHAVADIKTHTRRYAKRQMTWLQRYTDIHWFGREKISEILQVF